MSDKSVFEAVARTFIQNAETIEALLGGYPAIRQQFIKEWAEQGYPSQDLAQALCNIPEFMSWHKSVSAAEFGVTLSIAWNSMSVGDAEQHQQPDDAADGGAE